jgi:hypothetical protein
MQLDAAPPVRRMDTALLLSCRRRMGVAGRDVSFSLRGGGIGEAGASLLAGAASVRYPTPEEGHARAAARCRRPAAFTSHLPASLRAGRRAARGSAIPPTHRRSRRSSPSCAAPATACTVAGYAGGSSCSDAPACASTGRLRSPRPTLTRAADRCSYAAARAAAAAKWACTTGPGSSSSVGDSRITGRASQRVRPYELARLAADGSHGETSRGPNTKRSRPRRARIAPATTTPTM